MSSEGKNEEKTEDFKYIATAPSHSIGITKTLQVFSWGKNNTFGQLGRNGPVSAKLPVNNIPNVSGNIRVFAGGLADSGHSAVLIRSSSRTLDHDQLYLCGCDRWQQLGLGSPSTGTAGYTWNSVYQVSFQHNVNVTKYLQDLDETSSIRDMALGGDHSLVLSTNRKDVIAFGKNQEGQLGLSQKTFLSSITKSKGLSQPGTAAVCAWRHCSFTLDDQGQLMRKAGKCDIADFREQLKACQKRANSEGLLNMTE